MRSKNHRPVRGWTRLVVSFSAVLALAISSAAVANPSDERWLAAGIEPASALEVLAEANTQPALDGRGSEIVRGFLIAQEEDVPTGVVGPITNLNAPFTNSLGAVGFTGSASDGMASSDSFVWSGLGVQFVDTSVAGQTLSGAEGTMGIGDSGQFIYSPSVDGSDSVWTHNGLLQTEDTQAPGFAPGINNTFNSRPTMSPSGASFWISGFNETGGAVTEGRVLYTSPDSTSGNITVVLRSDDIVGGLAIARPSGVNFDYDFSDDATHLIVELQLNTGSTVDDGAIYVDGSLVAREAQPSGAGDNWDNFDSLSINNAGTYVFSGDTDGATGSDEFIAVDGTIVVREGSTVGGVALTTTAAVQALSINNLDQLVHLWSISGGGKVLFFSCSAANAATDSVPVLSTGDSLDLNGDGMGDASVTGFNAFSSTGPGLSLASDGAIHAEVTLDYGTGGLQAIVRVPLPSCVPGVTVTPTTGLVTTEAGGTDSFEVVLDTQPSADVSIALSSDNPAEGNPDSATLVFSAANWDVPQTVTVTGADDDIDDGDVAYSIVTAAAVSMDTDYAGIDPDDVGVTNTDDDTAGITVTPSSGLITTEAGGSDSFTVVLDSEPTMDVSIDLASSDGTEGSPDLATLMFTAANWDTPQTVTVTGADDLVVDGDVGYSIVTAAAVSMDPTYAGIDPADVGMMNIDDDIAGITVTPTSGLISTEAGGSDSFTVVLSSEPSMDVSIDLASSDVTEGSADLTMLVFTAANWDTPQTVTVTGADDDIDDDNVPYSIVTAAAVSMDPNYAGIDADDVGVTNTDDDTAGITVTPTSGLITTEAGGSDTFTVVLDSEPSMDVSINLASSQPTEGAADAATLVFTAANWDTPQTVTVSGVDDAVVDGDQPYMITTAPALSADGNYGGLDASDVSATNIDDDTAGISIDDVSVTEGTGGNTTATFTVTVDTAVAGGFSVDYSTADGTATAPADYTAATGTLNFTGGAGETQSIAVTVIADSTFEPDETYTVELGAPSNPAVTLTDGSGLGGIVDDDSADLAVVLNAAPDPVIAGTQLTYTVTVSNAGPADAADVSVSLSIPTGASVVSSSVGGGGSCSGAGPVICSYAGPITPGVPRSATIVVDVAPSVLMALSSTATVSTSTVDTNPANDSSSATTAISAAADLSLEMTIVPADGVVGDFFTLNATASNAGPSDAQQLAITIDVPQGLVIINSNPSSGGTCSVAPPANGSVTLSCGYSGATSPGAQRSVQALLQSAASGLIAVDASVNSDTTDPTANNNSAAAGVAAGVQQIPALHPMMLAFLALLLSGMGVLVMRRS